jgi:AcrR family transcriptional regulator
MEVFPVGSHVVIELMDERKIAGYLVSGSMEDGLVLRVTHKDSALVRRVSETMSADIAGQLRRKNGLWLRANMALRGHFRGVIAGRDAMIAQLQDDIEADILEGAEDGVQFRELSAPVTTFVSAGAIMLMEDTDDKIQEAEVSMFDQTLDAALLQILESGKQEEEETNESTESDGTDTGADT